MANEQNLRDPCRGFTVEEQSKGGQESAKVRKLRSSIQKTMELKVPKSMADVHKLLDDMGIKKTDRHYVDAVAMVMVNKALKGDVQAATWVRDTAGEKPTDKVEADLGQRTVDRLAGLSLSQKGQMLDAMLEEARGEKKEEE